MEDLVLLDLEREIAKAKERYPLFFEIPTTQLENLEYRVKLRQKAETSKEFREDILHMCAQDSLFWAASFVFLYEPRKKTNKVIPFCPWVHQIPIWMRFEDSFGIEDFGVEKSRGEGLSWIACILCTHRFIFEDGFSAGFVSKDEASVDTADNPDSLFWKIDFMFDHLPTFMRPRIDRSVSKHTFYNHDNHASMSGFAATGNVASGGRKTVMVMDELGKFPPGKDRQAMDSTFPVTDSRLLISTPFGPSGAYYDAMKGKSNMKKIQVHWSQNPDRNRGAYLVNINEDNTRELVIIDKPYWLKRLHENGFDAMTIADVSKLAEKVRDETPNNPFGYSFMMTGEYVKHARLRSPWYDRQCNRPGATPKSIAQELDLDYGGSASRFFDINLLERLKKKCDGPLVRGELVFPKCDNHQDLMSHPPKLRQNQFGRFHLWTQLDVDNRPPQNRNYVVGCDIASGTGGIESSNSSITILDRDSGEQVGVFTSPDVIPTELADLAVAICYFFSSRTGPAKLNWESNGLGKIFTKRIKQLEFFNVYYRDIGSQETEYERYTSQSAKLGWASTKDTKAQLLGEWGRALSSGDLIVNDEHCIEEAKFYVNLPGGKIEHIAASTEDDPAGAGERHGDRVIGNAIAWWLAKDYVGGSERQRIINSEIPQESLMGRRLAAMAQQRAAAGWKPRSLRRLSSEVQTHSSSRYRNG